MTCQSRQIILLPMSARMAVMGRIDYHYQTVV